MVLRRMPPHIHLRSRLVHTGSPPQCCCQDRACRTVAGEYEYGTSAGETGTGGEEGEEEEDDWCVAADGMCAPARMTDGM